ncbi:MAG: NAD/NADP octopine/nopaline dehydrogenase family protein [Candidatus Bathyarchaeota archaeon]|nr:NAD/NADP octopine/nopaline dehydrogenase family protein [Candidatus Bathyarchaeota archaeon]
MVKRATILGCGSGGMTMAVDLGLKGFKINIFDFPDYSKNLKLVEEKGSIEAYGNLEGKVEPDVITTDMNEAVQDSDAIFATIRAYGAERFILEAAKHMEPGQIIMNWSSYLAALRTYKEFNKIAPKETILGEGAILPYFVKPTAPGVMNVFGVKAHLWAAAMPGNKTPELIKVVKEFFPNCEAAPNVLYTSLTNPNLQVHVPPVLLNTGFWEKNEGDLEFYGTLMTPKVAHVMDLVDKERIAVGKKLGLELIPKPEVLKMEYGQYGVKGETMYEVYSTFASHRSWRPGLSLDDFAAKTAFGEDLLYGYVFISSLGDQFGIPTPAIDTMTNLAELVLQRDFWKEGVSVKSLGFEGMTPEQIMDYVMKG